MEWRQLQDMHGWLDVLPERLSAFAEVSTEQRRRGQVAGAMLHDEGLIEAKATFAGHVDTIRSQLAELQAMAPRRRATAVVGPFSS